jgi:hypothetical protein
MVIWLVVSNIFYFHNIWDNPSRWLIFFKMVKTTNQSCSIANCWFSRGYPAYKVRVTITPGMGKWAHGQFVDLSFQITWFSSFASCWFARGYGTHSAIILWNPNARGQNHPNIHGLPTKSLWKSHSNLMNHYFPSVDEPPQCAHGIEVCVSWAHPRHYVGSMPGPATWLEVGIATSKKKEVQDK